MGREIRRVPPNWQHPKYAAEEVQYDWQRNAYKPLRQGYAEAKEEFESIQREKGLQEAIDYCGVPDVNDYVPNWKAEEATWFQVYETVSEGTPVTPPFSSKEALVEYLVQHGDFWRQKEGKGGFSRAAAESFVKDEWAPSMIVDGKGVHVGIESADRT